MTRKLAVRFTFLSLIMVLALASCNLPTITPPPAYAPTDVPTDTATVEPTAIPATATPVPQALVISATNAIRLAAVNKAPANNVQSLTWSTDSSTLGLVSQNQDASGNYVYSATLLDASLAVKTVWAEPDGGRITQISPDGRLAAVISSDMKTLKMIDLGDGNKDVVEISPQYAIGGATFSPDGKTFSFTNYEAMSVSVNSLPSGSEIKTLSGFTTAAPVFDVGYAGNSAELVWKARATIQLQDIASGTLGATFNHEDFVSAYRLSPDGKVLASAALKTINGNPEPAIELWNAAQGTEQNILLLPQTAISLDFSPDGSLLAVATGNDVQLWDVTSATQIATLSSHSAPVSLVAFSADGKTLASCGQDNQLILWQVYQ